MGILNRVFYAQSWEEDYRKSLIDECAEDGIESIEEVKVVPGDWGISARIKLPGRSDCTFYPIHRDSVELSVGDELDPEFCTIIHLKRAGAKTEKLLYTGEVL